MTSLRKAQNGKGTLRSEMKLASATTLSTDSVAHGRGVRRIFMSTGDEGQRSIFLLRFLQICQKEVNRKSRKINILYRKQGAGFAFEQVAHNLIGDRTKTKKDVADGSKADFCGIPSERAACADHELSVVSVNVAIYRVVLPLPTTTTSPCALSVSSSFMTVGRLTPR